MQLRSHQLEQYPRIGQLVNYWGGFPGEIARVDTFIRYEKKDDGEILSGYRVSRILYAHPHHVEALDGRALCVGTKVRLLAGHTESDLHINATGFFEITEICVTCHECVELRQHFAVWDYYLELDLPASRDIGCPLNHEYKCSHLGHEGACKYVCPECDGWWDDVQLQCRCCDSGDVSESESQQGVSTGGAWSGAWRSAWEDAFVFD